MSEYDELVRRIRRRQASMRDSGEIPLSRRNDADLAADAIEALEAKVTALERERDELRAEIDRLHRPDRRHAISVALGIEDESTTKQCLEIERLRAEVERLRGAITERDRLWCKALSPEDPAVVLHVTTRAIALRQDAERG